VNLGIVVITVWSMALVSGAWVAIGVASAMTGRMIVNPRRIEWSLREVEMLASMTILQGLAGSVYALAGGLFLTGTVTPFWVGHAWGIFIGLPLYLFLMGTFGIQAYVQYRHFKRREKSTAEPHRASVPPTRS
jgi:hypothetical protein